ncbi:phosphate/phosphite/phosphonate ABC transporter substrate-binding protein [Massilia sp. CFBP9012]|uniref:phosphate/phosphite/phosphonate ABC transporter substrate-binding protein n=1 Tax=Massilia sp. CFBP9012 TaxID=3096531 RepID=UPI002A69CD5C|nr:phosphate/phosphite/phosphonate ABC transporter substrate-binding protein [Massilia sp. CFBP9012]MDY0976522.1 phosphate/phosphite/phosphonate ABC transporter substrate-binding protein [Massilia sp. CFBP9012]
MRLPLLAALGALGAPALAAACERPDRLRFSIIPRGDVRKEIADLQPLLDQLRAALGIPVEVYAAPSYGAVVEALLSGAVHLARLGPASYVSARRADPMLTPFANYANKASRFQPAGAFYHSLLIVRARSALADVGALRGKRLALVDPESTSGALIPRHVFAKQVGRPLEAYFSQVGYSGSHTQSINRVLAGQIDAAFVGSQNLATEMASHPARERQIRVVWRSGPIPTDPFVFRGQLCEGLQEKIRGAFFKSGGPQSADVLDKLNVARFVPVSDGDYRIVHEIY